MNRISYTGKGHIERTVLAAMIVSREVIQSVSPVWEVKAGPFASPWANVVGDWCVQYFRKYGNPPGQDILGVFARWCEKRRDKAEVQLMEQFFSALDASSDGKVNPKFVLDLAEEVFTKERVRRAVDALQGELDRPDSAGKDLMKVLSDTAKPVSLTGAAGVSFDDPAVIARMLAVKPESIIKYPGAAGEFYGDSLCRSGFVAFLAPEKRGKSHHLIDLAVRAMLQKRRVMFFSVGDLTEPQMARRVNARMIGRPLFKTKAERPVLYPKSLVVDEGVPLVEHEVRKYAADVTPDELAACWKKVREEKLKSDEQFFKHYTYPTSSFKASEVRAAAVLSARQGWVPDVVVIDYADILAPESGAADTRDQINATWKMLNALRQELDCLVVTATQAKATAYESELIGMGDYSEDKRKYAHVTGMVAINQTDGEKMMGVQRLNWIVLREEEFVSTKVVYLAGSLAYSAPAVRSSWAAAGPSS